MRRRRWRSPGSSANASRRTRRCSRCSSVGARGTTRIGSRSGTTGSDPDSSIWRSNGCAGWAIGRTSCSKTGKSRCSASASRRIRRTGARLARRRAPRSLDAHPDLRPARPCRPPRRGGADADHSIAARKPGIACSIIWSLAVIEIRKYPGRSKTLPGMQRMSCSARRPQNVSIVGDRRARQQIERRLRRLQLITGIYEALQPADPVCARDVRCRCSAPRGRARCTASARSGTSSLESSASPGTSAAARRGRASRARPRRTRAAARESGAPSRTCR